MVSTSIYSQKILNIFNNHILSEANHLSTSNNQPVLTEDNKCQLRLFFAKSTKYLYSTFYTNIHTHYKSQLQTARAAVSS
jgi:hypothetical protein